MHDPYYISYRVEATNVKITYNLGRCNIKYINVYICIYTGYNNIIKMCVISAISKICNDIECLSPLNYKTTFCILNDVVLTAIIILGRFQFMTALATCLSNSDSKYFRNPTSSKDSASITAAYAIALLFHSVAMTSSL